MAKRIDITNIARRIITGEDVEPKLSKRDYGRLLQLMARWTRSAQRKSKLARATLAEQPHWHAQYHTLLEDHRRLERTYTNLKRNYEALEEQQQRHSLQFDEVTSALNTEVHELREKLVQQEYVGAVLLENLTATESLRGAEHRMMNARMKLHDLGLSATEEKPAET